MKLSRMVMIYFFVGVVMFGAGVIPADQVGLVSVWVDDPADPSVNEDEVSPTENGMLSNLIGPVKNALGTVAGGGLLSVFGAIDRLLGFYAWPVTAAAHLNAPWQAELISFGFVVAFTFGVLGVFRPSI